MSIISKITNIINDNPEEWSNYNNLFIVISNLPDGKEKWEHSKEFKKLLVNNIKSKVSISKMLSKLFEEVLLMEARGCRFDSYMQYLELDREPSKRFWLPRRKQLLPVVKAIQELIDDELDILSISLPPGTGKSTLEIFLHTMYLGIYPDQPSLASGHSGTLTNSIYEGVMAILRDKVEYRWHDIFPDAGEIFTNAKEQTVDIGKKHRFSSLTCRAIGASLTGATRCEVLLTADDLVSGYEEAISIDRLDKLWQSYTNDLKSRKKLGCKELHLATRWSVHDVIGRLQRMYEGDDRVKFISMDATDENDESNFDYMYGVGFDTSYFRDMRDTLDKASYDALFRNQPIEREGLVYQIEELRRYYELPNGEPDSILAICDTKDRGTDYAFMPIVYVYGTDHYVVDAICDNSLPEVLDSRLTQMLLEHKVQYARFESNSAGGRVAEKIQAGVKEKGGRTHITTKFTTSNKVTRIIINSAWVKEHCLFLNDYNYNSDYGTMMRFLTGYTMAGKNKFDDVPDGFGQYAEFAQGLTGNKVEIFTRTF